MHKCNLDLSRDYKRDVFNFAYHRQPEKYRRIVEQKGVVLPPE